MINLRIRTICTFLLFLSILLSPSFAGDTLCFKATLSGTIKVDSLPQSGFTVSAVCTTPDSNNGRFEGSGTTNANGYYYFNVTRTSAKGVIDESITTCTITAGNGIISRTKEISKAIIGNAFNPCVMPVCSAPVVVNFNFDTPSSPLSLSPADSTLIHSDSVQMSWISGTDTNAKHDEWQFADNPSFTGAETNNNAVSPITKNSLAYGTTYYWRVRTCDEYGSCSPWVLRTFTASNNAPSFSVIPDVDLIQNSGLNENVLNLNSYASDSDSDDLIFQITSQSSPEIVSCSIDSNEYIDCTVFPSFYGTSVVSLSADDGHTGTATASFNVNVVNANSVPVIDFSSVEGNSTNEDTAKLNMLNLSRYITDADNDILAFSITSQSNPSLISCSITDYTNISCGTPSADASGFTELTIQATDGKDIVSDILIVTVLPVNDAPVFVSSSATDFVNVGQQVSFSAQWTDIDSSAVSAYFCNDSSCSSILCNTSLSSAHPAVCTYTSMQSDLPETSYWVMLFDGADYSAVSAGTDGFFEVNHAPVLTANPSIPAGDYYANSLLTCSAGTFYDIDSDSQLPSFWSWYADSVPVSTPPGSTSSFQCSPALCPRGALITCSEIPVDEHNIYGSYYYSSAVTILNTIPVISGLPDLNLYEDSGIYAGSESLDTYVYEIDEDVLTFTITENTAPSLVSCSIVSGEFLECIVPETNLTGTATITIEVSDGTDSNSDSFEINVLPVNDAPYLDFTGVSGNWTYEDIPADNMLLLSDYAFDVDNTAGELSFQIVRQSNEEVVSCSIDTSNYLDCAPVANSAGFSEIEILVSDGEYDSTAILLISVLPVNDAPILISSSSSDITNVGQNVVFLAVWYDLDSGSINLEICRDISCSETLCSSGLTASNPVSCAYTAQQSDSAVNQYWVRAYDGVDYSDIYAGNDTFAVNHAPLIDIPDFSFDEDTEYFIDLSSYISDADNLNSELHITVSGNTEIMFQNTTNTEFTFSASANWTGTEVFSFTVYDPHQLFSSDNVAVTVLPVNDAPVFISSSATDSANVGGNITFTAEWTDADNDAVSFNVCRDSLCTEYFCASSTNECNYTVLESDPSLNYYWVFVNDSSLSSPIFEGTDLSFSVNHAPVISFAGITGNSTLEDAPAPNLFNLSDYAYDVNNDALLFSIVSQSNPSLISCSVTDYTNISCGTPYHDASGFTELNITVTDLKDTLASAVLRITVVPVNDAPYLNFSNMRNNITLEDTPAPNMLNLSKYAYDAENDRLSFAIDYQSNPSLISCSITDYTNISCGMPAPDTSGFTELNITVADTNSGFGSEILRITVSSEYDPPVFNFTGVSGNSTTEDVSIFNFVNLSRFATDADEDVLSFSIVSQSNPEVVNCYIEYSTNVSCVPVGNMSGVSSVRFSADDGVYISYADLKITVNPVNDIPVVYNATLNSGLDFHIGDNLLVSANAYDVDSPMSISYRVYDSTGQVYLGSFPQKTCNSASCSFVNASISDVSGRKGPWHVTFSVYDGFTNVNSQSADVYMLNTVPSAPVLVPEPDAHELIFELEWTPGTDANIEDTVFTEFEFADDADFSAILNSSVSAISPVTVNVVYNEDYYWRIRTCDGTDCSAWVSDSFLTINNPPVAVLGANVTTFRYINVSFDASASHDINNDPLEYFWDFGDSFQAQGITAVHQYSSLGEFTVNLTVSDGLENSSAVMNVTVLNRIPSISLSSNTSTVFRNEEFILTVASFDADSDPLYYRFDMRNDGINDTAWSADNSVSVTVSAPGVVTIRAEVTDNFGINESLVNVTVLNRAPVLDFIEDISVYENETIQIVPSGYEPENDAYAFFYSGWMNSSTYKTTYTDAGMHTVNVTMLDEYGASSSQIVNIEVINVNTVPLITSFAPLNNSVFNEGASVAVSFSAYDEDNDVLEYTVMLDSVPVSSPVYFDYSSSGVHNMTLFVSDSVNTVSETHFVLVNNVNRAPENVSITNPSSYSFFAGQQIEFAGFAQDPDSDILSYTWDMGDSTIVVGTNTVNHTYYTEGIYNVSFTAHDGMLSASDSMLIYIGTALPPLVQNLSYQQSVYFGTDVAVFVDVYDPLGVNSVYINDASGMKQMSLISGNTYSYVYVSPDVGTRSFNIFANNTFGSSSGSVSGAFNVISTNGTLSGVITNSTGSRITNALVAVNGMNRVTGADGAYSFSIINGTYIMSVSADNYLPQTAEVNILTGLTTVKDFSLQKIITDIQVSSVSFEPIVVEGDSINVSASVQNLGNTAGTFNVTFTVDSVLVGSQNITLNPSQAAPVSFIWTAVEGNHVIGVGVNPLYGEINTANNFDFEPASVLSYSDALFLQVSAPNTSPYSTFTAIVNIWNLVDKDIYNIPVEIILPAEILLYSSEPSIKTATLIPASSTGLSASLSWYLNSTVLGNYTVNATIYGKVNASDPIEVRLPSSPILDVELTAPPMFVSGVYYNVSAYVSNNGNSTALSCNTTLMLPSQLSTSSPNPVILGDVLNGTMRTISWSVVASQTGTYTLSAVAECTGYNASETQQTVNLTQKPQLLLDLQFSSPVSPNANIPVSITLLNNGTAVSNNITLDFMLPVSAVIVSGNLSVSGINLLPGEQITRNYVVVFNEQGDFTIKTTAVDSKNYFNDDYGVITVSAPSLLHDIAVLGLNAPAFALSGSAISATADILNKGSSNETVEVLLLADSILIDSKIIQIKPGETVLVNFSLFSLTSIGSSYLYVTARQVPGETETSDNTAGSSINVLAKPVVLILNPETLQLSFDYGSSGAGKIKVTNNDTQNLTVNAVFDSNYVSVTPLNATIAPGQSFEFEVSSSYRTAGQFETNVSFAGSTFSRQAVIKINVNNPEGPSGGYIPASGRISNIVSVEGNAKQANVTAGNISSVFVHTITLPNLTLSLEGIPSEWYSIRKINGLFEVNFTIPKKIPSGLYGIFIKVANTYGFAEKIPFTIAVEGAEFKNFSLSRQTGISFDAELASNLTGLNKTEAMQINNTSANRTYSSSKGVSTMSLVITAGQNLEMLYVYEVIPKEFALDVSALSFSITPSRIINDDPVVVWEFSNVTEEQQITVSYFVDAELDESIIELFESPVVFASKQPESSAPSDTNTDTQKKQNFLITGWAFLESAGVTPTKVALAVVGIVFILLFAFYGAPAGDVMVEHSEKTCSRCENPLKKVLYQNKEHYYCTTCKMYEGMKLVSKKSKNSCPKCGSTTSLYSFNGGQYDFCDKCREYTFVSSPKKEKTKTFIEKKEAPLPKKKEKKEEEPKKQKKFGFGDKSKKCPNCGAFLRTYSLNNEQHDFCPECEQYYSHSKH